MVPALAQGVPSAPRRTSPEDDASRPTHLAAPADGTTLRWQPWPRRHRVTLVHAGGQTLDEIRL